jgi:hypothetical protein
VTGSRPQPAQGLIIDETWGAFAADPATDEAWTPAALSVAEFGYKWVALRRPQISPLNRW